MTLTTEMMFQFHKAVEAGDHALHSEIVREARRDWSQKRRLLAREFEDLRNDVRFELDSLEAGGVRDVDPERIAQEGRKRLPRRLRVTERAERNLAEIWVAVRWR